MFFSDKEKEIFEDLIDLYHVSWAVGYRRGSVDFSSEERAWAFFRLIQNWFEEDFDDGKEFEICFYETNSSLKWVWRHAVNSTKERVSNPKHRVFIRAWSRDCDGMSETEYVSFPSLEEGVAWLQKCWYPSLEGPSEYETISREEWEGAEYPEFIRDPYAEAMGY